MTMFNTAVLLVIFNRPESTQRVFDTIRKIKPARLYVAADGPRASKAGEKEKSAVARRIATSIDWDCRLYTLFQDQNLGCGTAVSTAIDWFFSNEEEGIILEDDCVPEPGFFEFAGENLRHYRDNENIFHISGTNIQHGINRGTASYYFSQIPHMWGWATWKRAWKFYSMDMTHWEEGVRIPEIHPLWVGIFDKIKNGEISTWDYQWVYTILKLKKLCLTPNRNLVTNIGFTTHATHTLEKPSWYQGVVAETLGTLTHPRSVKLSKNADSFTMKLLMNRFGIKERLLMKYIRIFKQRRSVEKASSIS
jgi:hypothetical protein